MTDTRSKIEKILLKAFNPLKLNVRDDSHEHAGHAGASQNGGGHFTVEIVAERFRGMGKLACHRLIYDTLFPQLNNEIHALSINAKAP